MRSVYFLKSSVFPLRFRSSSCFSRLVMTFLYSRWYTSLAHKKSMWLNFGNGTLTSRTLHFSLLDSSITSCEQKTSIYIYIYIYIYIHTHTHTHTHIVHLRQECQNSKFCIFELLVQKETFAGALLTGIAAQRSLQNSPLESSCVVVALRILQHFKIFKRFSWKTANFELWHYYRKGAIYIYIYIYI